MTAWNPPIQNLSGWLPLCSRQKRVSTRSDLVLASPPRSRLRSRPNVLTDGGARRLAWTHGTNMGG
eukprot:3023715-Lingulodinium_polyedra.AAC.1